ncbi:hypothetical protein [Bacillus thuringiensis]|uniref:hypothetical protein n=1 Tax=Bacillus thuringiensis TaxID=1428 RepID=UPI002AB3E799|nr:hypothetical protein [Bacillus thuringiensis]MDY7965639.1 hypothetical protein [Bacillus thuringiensis]
MNQSHVSSCDCGCQQDKYGYGQQQSNNQQNSQYMLNNDGSGNYNGSYGQQQSNNQQNSQYMLNNDGSGNYNGSYGQQQSNNQQNSQYMLNNDGSGNYNGSYGQQQSNNQNIYTRKRMHGNHKNYSGYSILNDLPDESKNFQMIKNAANTSSPTLVMDARDSVRGESLEHGSGGCPGTVPYQNTIINRRVGTNDKRQYFIFYKMDDGNFIIGNQENSRVLELVSNPQIPNEQLLISNRITDINIKQTQIFSKDILPNNQFRLTLKENERNWMVNNCNGDPNIEQVYIGYPSNYNNIYKFEGSKSPVNFPDLSITPKPLPLPRNLTGLGDIGDIPQEIKGNSLVPGIIVLDFSLPVSQQLQLSPYYVLEYTQTWFPVTNTVLQPYGNHQWPEYKGITLHDQLNMQSTVGMTVGGTTLGWGLKFGGRANLFKRTILLGLSIPESLSNDMGFEEMFGYYENRTASQIRYIKYIKAHQLRLKRLDKLDDSVEEWTIYNKDDYQIRTYPVNAII